MRSYIIGIAGTKGSGKDTVANMINYIFAKGVTNATYANYVLMAKKTQYTKSDRIIHFADIPKQIISLMFGIPINKLNDRKYKDEMFYNLNSGTFLEPMTVALDVTSGLIVWPKVIEAHVKEQLPFMATENIMMDAVKNGGNRQELHEKIRTLSMEAGKNVKQEGKENNLLELIAADPEFNLTLEDLQKTMDPSKYVGRSPIQVDNFIKNVIQPVLDAHKEELGMTAEINV